MNWLRRSQDRMCDWINKFHYSSHVHNYDTYIRSFDSVPSRLVSYSIRSHCTRITDVQLIYFFFTSTFEHVLVESNFLGTFLFICFCVFALSGSASWRYELLQLSIWFFVLRALDRRFLFRPLDTLSHLYSHDPVAFVLIFIPAIDMPLLIRYIQSRSVTKWLSLPQSVRSRERTNYSLLYILQASYVYTVAKWPSFFESSINTVKKRSQLVILQQRDCRLPTDPGLPGYIRILSSIVTHYFFFITK